ncbi:MAG: PilZ domain-containing protein [Nitrospira sp.]|nr:PilZ domain-containing protein [Nitrospira sp.]MDH4243526.1 PilZ domain-containing protein [Nitrospira sp.]MDH4355591.1 PilZ domain-containing protein [Nitrospira sp.]MDH5318083.1 PilZ domain-containing protein [Nitrospira sp.]
MFIIRPYRRFPVACPVAYEHCFQEGQGTVWNVSSTGWRMSGDVPLQCGDVCSLNVILPTNKPVSVAAGIVRWVKGEEFGIEILVMDGKAQTHLGKYIQERMKDL